jgi:hypothetical protein
MPNGAEQLAHVFPSGTRRTHGSREKAEAVPAEEAERGKRMWPRRPTYASQASGGDADGRG